MRTLVVEDEPILARNLSKASEGYSADVARDGETGQALAHPTTSSSSTSSSRGSSAGRSSASADRANGFVVPIEARSDPVRVFGSPLLGIGLRRTPP